MRRAWPIKVILICICSFATSLQAEPLDVQQWSGRVVYLDFWASWCGPCRQSFPWMEKMKAAYGSQGLTIVAINVDQSRADADRFLARFHPDFEVRFDPQGRIAQQFNITGMPTSVIFDRHGVARFTHIGFRPVDEDQYARDVRSLLAEH